jgi:hypothetical protein
MAEYVKVAKTNEIESGQIRSINVKGARTAACAAIALSLSHDRSRSWRAPRADPTCVRQVDRLGKADRAARHTASFSII